MYIWNALEGRFRVHTWLCSGGLDEARSGRGFRGTALTRKRSSVEAAEKVECFFSPENLIIEMIPDFVLFGIIFSILARLFLSKCAF